MTAHGLPRVDITGSLVRFAGELRRAGLSVGTSQLEVLLRAFQWLDPTSTEHVYHASRTTLLTRYEDAKLFDALFQAFWGVRAAGTPQRVPLAPRQQRQSARPQLINLLAQRAFPHDPEVQVDDRSHSSSDAEVLRRKDFSTLSALELAALRRLLATRRWAFAERVSRRKLSRARGPRLDLRRLPSCAARSGGVVLRLPRLARKIKPRPIVVLADVSGSMELYTRVLLQFFHALQHQLGRVETFVFATRLTRVTNELGLTNPDRALDAVCSEVVDFASGTRIGESLHAFNTRWAGRMLGRGAVAIVVSDGWERGDADLLGKEVRILRDRCYRLIWLNPLLGQPSYEPRVAGMAAALRHVDDFLACHNLQSLGALEAHLGRLPARRGGIFEHVSRRAT